MVVGRKLIAFKGVCKFEIVETWIGVIQHQVWPVFVLVAFLEPQDSHFSTLRDLSKFLN
jgi:predicted metal-dependent phosphoesterase TrpH